MILLRYKHSQKSLVRNCEHYLETMMMTDETTSEQLAEIEGQAEPVQVREGRWRTRHGDIRNVTPTPAHDSRAKRWPWRDAKYDQTWREDGGYHIIGESPSDLVEYLGPIEPDKTQELPDKTQELPDKTQELDGKTQELPEYTPPEGWRVVRFGELLQPGDVWVNSDGTERRSDILHWDASAVSGGRCIRRIEPEPQPEPQPNAAAIEELRSEVSYVQNLLGESRQRVTQLEELVASLRTINAAQEKAVVDAGKANDKHVDTIGQMQRELQQQHRELQKRALRIFDLDTINAAQEKAVVDAGKENTALRRQLAVVKEELTTAAAVSQQLQIELDAAQQVPADSPELLQLRLRLADMTLDRDQCKNAYDQIFADLVTIRETTAAETVEAIIEWLQPFRGCNSPALALLLLEALPHIMRHLTGLAED